MNKVSKKCIISGKVQGVFFRQGTFEQATSLGIKGWVRNLASGDVECVICGTPEAVEILIDWLWEGPAAARVENVEIQDIAWQDFESFIIKR